MVYSNEIQPRLSVTGMLVLFTCVTFLPSSMFLTEASAFSSVLAHWDYRENVSHTGPLRPPAQPGSGRSSLLPDCSVVQGREKKEHRETGTKYKPQERKWELIEVDAFKRMRRRGSAQWIVRGVLQPETQDRHPLVDAAASHVFIRNRRSSDCSMSHVYLRTSSQ